MLRKLHFTETEKLLRGLETRGSNIRSLHHTRQNGVSLVRNVLRLQFGTWLGLDSSHVAEFGRRNENFATTSFQEVVTRKQHTPNWEEYRIRKGRLWKIKEQSSHWRVTCYFSTFGVD